MAEIAFGAEKTARRGDCLVSVESAESRLSPGLLQQTSPTKTAVGLKIPARTAGFRAVVTVLAARAILAAGAILTGSFSARTAIAQPPQDASLLPFVTTDVVIRRNSVTGQETRLAGVIEDLTGDVVQLRRSGAGRVERLRLRDVAELQFRKSGEYDGGLRALAAGDAQTALNAFDAALISEQRTWVLREIQASAVQALFRLGRRDEIIGRIEKVTTSDPDTRHVALLPLVWDERLPETERLAATPADLEAASPLRRLSAASVLLQDPSSETQAVRVLMELRTAARPRVQELAEIQLWRIRILHPEQLRRSDVMLWQSRVRDFDRVQRGAAEFLLGRALLAQHDYDAASLSLLWLPTLSEHDPSLAAASLADVITALEQSGRFAEAATTTAELQSRFPQSSAAVRLTR